MAKVLVCEDEENTLEMISMIARSNPLVDSVYSAKSGMRAVEIIKESSPDILLLDIDLPDINGIEVAREAVKLRDDIYVVFITGYAEFAVDSFEVHPYDYILKPIDISKLTKTLEKLTETFENSSFRQKMAKLKKLAIRDETGFVLLNMDDVLFIEKVGKELIVHTTTGEYKCMENLKNVEESLDERFYRVHKSYIVNIMKVESIQNNGGSYVVTFLNSDKCAMMSREWYKAIRDVL